jgi:hypothetical protein
VKVWLWFYTLIPGSLDDYGSRMVISRYFVESFDRSCSRLGTEDEACDQLARLPRWYASESSLLQVHLPTLPTPSLGNATIPSFPMAIIPVNVHLLRQTTHR